MSLSLQAFAPAALLLLGSLVLLWRSSATVFVLVQLATLVALLRLSQLSAATLTIAVYDPLPDVPLVLRLDRLALFFATTAVATALLVALPWFGDRERRLPFGWLVLAEFGAVGGMLAGNLQGLAAGWGVYVAALLMLVVVPEPGSRQPGTLPRPVMRTLVVQLAGATLLVLAAVVVEASTGTASYDAVPVGAIDGRTQALLVAAPVMALGTLAGVLRACRRPAVAALLVTSAVLPLSAYTLARTVDLAEGRALPGAAGYGLLVVGALGATLLGMQATWAPDLGAALARLLNALGMLLVAAYALGGSGALVALLVGFMALEVASAAGLGMLDAGSGRLPTRGLPPGWVLGTLCLLPLAGVGGLVVAMSLDARLLVLRRVLDLGVPGALAGIPVLTACAAILGGAFAAGRFGGGRLTGTRGLLQLLFGAAALVAVAAAAPLLRDISVSLASAAARVPVADVRSSATALVPGQLLGAAMLVAVVVAAMAAGNVARVFDRGEGLRVAPDVLPPRLAVAPEIVLRRTGSTTAARVARGLGMAAAHPRWVTVLAWVAATAVVLFAAR